MLFTIVNMMLDVIFWFINDTIIVNLIFKHVMKVSLITYFVAFNKLCNN